MQVRFSRMPSSHHIVKVIRGGQHKLQMLTSFFAFRCFFVPQDVLHERPLIC